MHKRRIGILLFAVTIVLLIGLLMVVNWLPTAIQEGIMKQYATVDDLRAGLNVRDVHVPSYFPESLTWPPSRIFGQSRPYVLIIMEFNRIGSGETGLVITQSAAAEIDPDRKITILQIKERVPYALKGRAADLIVGSCGNDEPCSRISWKEGEHTIVVSARLTPRDLIRIAESMIR